MWAQTLYLTLWLCLKMVNIRTPLQWCPNMLTMLPDGMCAAKITTEYTFNKLFLNMVSVILGSSYLIHAELFTVRPSLVANWELMKGSPTAWSHCSTSFWDILNILFFAFDAKEKQTQNSIMCTWNWSSPSAWLLVGCLLHSIHDHVKNSWIVKHLKMLDANFARTQSTLLGRN